MFNKKNTTALPEIKVHVCLLTLNPQKLNTMFEHLKYGKNLQKSENIMLTFILEF